MTAQISSYHEAELAKIHLKLWNYGKVALVYVIYSDRVDIFSCLQPPTLHQDQPRYQPAEQLVLAAQAARCFRGNVVGFPDQLSITVRFGKTPRIAHSFDGPNLLRLPCSKRCGTCGAK